MKHLHESYQKSRSLSQSSKGKTDVKSLQRENLLLVNKNYFTLEHSCIKNINKPAPLLHILLILLKC